MNVLDDVDLSGLSCLEDFDADDNFDDILRVDTLPIVKQEGSSRKSVLPGATFNRSKRNHQRQASNKRSFKDYTKPIKRGFLNRQIPANDIRRHLAQILIRACNDHDPASLERILTEFCGSSIVMTSRFIGDAETYPVKNGILYRELHGIQHIVHYLDALFEAVPDGLVKLLDTKVHMFQNGCSYIVGKFTFKGQKCFDMITLGDVCEKRLKHSRFEKKEMSAQDSMSFQQMMPMSMMMSYGNYGQESYAFDSLQESSGLSDLEDFLFDGLSSDEMGGQYNAYTNMQSSEAANQGKETMCVAHEDKDIKFVVPHSNQEVSELPLSFLGTIAFYLDPDAKIFKIEVLNTIEGAENTVKHHGKKARKH